MADRDGAPPDEFDDYAERDWKGLALRFKLGDRVRIRLSGGTRGRIVEWRGPLGPKGAQIYRVRIQGRAVPTFTEVREDQLILIPPKVSPPSEQPGSSSTPAPDPALPPVTG